MHVTPARPLWVSREDVPEEAVAKEKEIYGAQMANSGKPAQVVDRSSKASLTSGTAKSA